MNNPKSGYLVERDWDLVFGFAQLGDDTYILVDNTTNANYKYEHKIRSEGASLDIFKFVTDIFYD